MKKQISTLLGIVIIVVAIIILFGGVFAYQYLANPNFKIQNPEQIKNSNIQTACTSIHPTTPESITVTSPKSGDILTVGKKYNITWTSMGVGNQCLYIMLYPSNNPAGETVIEYNTDNTGSYFWTPDPTTLAGSYFISIAPEGINANLTETGNNIFSIVSPISSQTTQTAGWKTYTNAQYGFEFKFPIGNYDINGKKGFAYDANNGKYNISYVSDFQPEAIVVSFYDNSSECDKALCGGYGDDGTMEIKLLKNGIKNGVLYDSYFGEISNPITIPVGGKIAYRYKVENYCKGYLTEIPIQDNKMIEISLDDCYEGGTSDPGFPDSQIGIIDRILSTFKFTKQ